MELVGRVMGKSAILPYLGFEKRAEPVLFYDLKGTEVSGS